MTKAGKRLHLSGKRAQAYGHDTPLSNGTHHRLAAKGDDLRGPPSVPARRVWRGPEQLPSGPDVGSQLPRTARGRFPDGVPCTRSGLGVGDHDLLDQAGGVLKDGRLGARLSRQHGKSDDHREDGGQFRASFQVHLLGARKPVYLRIASRRSVSSAGTKRPGAQPTAHFERAIRWLSRWSGRGGRPEAPSQGGGPRQIQRRT